MVDMAVGILQGSLPGLSLPGTLLLVNLRAGRASSAAVCRKCCLGQVRRLLPSSAWPVSLSHLLAHLLTRSQVILSCFNLRRALVDLGGDGTDGGQLVELLAGAGDGVRDGDGDGAGQGGDVLLSTLSGPMLQTVLGIEADAAVAVMYQKQHAADRCV